MSFWFIYDIDILCFSVLLIISGCALYPLGWANQEVRDVCGGKTMPYQIGKCLTWLQLCIIKLLNLFVGTCRLSLSAYLIGIGLFALLFCIIFGLISVRKIGRSNTKSYDNLVILDRLWITTSNTFHNLLTLPHFFYRNAQYSTPIVIV